MSKQSKMTGADYLLLLLCLDNCSAINGAIRITKMMFLFNMEIVAVRFLFLKKTMQQLLYLRIIAQKSVLSADTKKQLMARQCNRN